MGRGTESERVRRVEKGGGSQVEKGCRDKLSLNGVSLDILTGIINLLDFDTLNTKHS